MNLKIVYMGTPEFSVKPLDELNKKYDVIAVVTQPDKKIGRKQEVRYSKVKEYALENNIKVLQPKNIREEYKKIIDLNPDIIITCAYGQIIPKVLLDYPRYKCINIHASLLPKYRGGSPIHRCIINGEKYTGITIMYMSPKMDEGDILYQEKDRLINKKRTINEFYSDKQNEIEKVHELEKYKLIEDYENQMREISQNYLNKKTECLKSMQDIEDKMREIENAKEEEKRTMYDEIDRLKNEGNNIEKEQEYLMKSNDELNHKLKETSNNIDLLRANTLGSNTLKSKGKKKIKNK